MYYYLLFNSSFIDDTNKIFMTLLYGTLLYIITHAITNYLANTYNLLLIIIIKNYFWYIFYLDVITIIYLIFISHNNSDHLFVTFNLLKNKINTYIYPNTNITVSSDNNQSINTIQQTYNNPDINNINSVENVNNKEYTHSTPIQLLLNKNKNINTNTNNILNNNLSTSIYTPIPTHTPIPTSTPTSTTLINNDNKIDFDNQSDLASIIDLDDFEQTL